MPALRDAPADDVGGVARRVLGPDALVDAFLEGRGRDTFLAYDRDLRDFGRFLGGMTAREAVSWLCAVDRGGPANEIVLRYRGHMAGRGLAPATIARRLAAIRSVTRLARTLGYIAWTIEIEDPRVQKYRDTRGPGLDGWRAMKATAEAMADGDLKLRNVHPDQAVRDLAMVHLIRALALRRSSATSIDLEDLELDAEKPAVWVRVKGKAQKVRRTIPAGALADLRRWLAARGEAPGPAFCRLHLGRGEDAPPQRLSGQSVYNIVKALGHRAGLRKKVRPHGLRHEAITAAARKGYRMDQIQQFAGHSDPRTTSLYIEGESDAAGKVADGIDQE